MLFGGCALLGLVVLVHLLGLPFYYVRSPRTIAILASLGSRVDSRDDEGRTPLMLASGAGDTEKAAALIGVGADVNATSGSLQTPLSLALVAGNFELADFLLDSGARFESDVYGPIVLNDLIAFNRPEAVAFALSRGARYDEPGRKLAGPSGRTALILAAERSQKQIVRLLVEAGADCDKSDGQGRSARSIALASGDVELVELVSKCKVKG